MCYKIVIVECIITCGVPIQYFSGEDLEVFYTLLYII